MKKLIFLATLIVASVIGVQANAQIQSDVVPGEIKYTYFGKFKNAEGITLSKKELGNYLDTAQYYDYRNGAKKLRNGYILTGTGALIYVIGATQQSAGYRYVGGILAVIGIPNVIIGHSKLNNVAKNYNSQQNFSVNFGGQEHGVGLALTF